MWLKLAKVSQSGSKKVISFKSDVKSTKCYFQKTPFHLSKFSKQSYDPVKWGNQISAAKC